MKVLITAGGTRASIDGIRWIGNGATGGLGLEMAETCLSRGAQVVHLVGPGALRVDQTVWNGRDSSAEAFDRLRKWADDRASWWPRYQVVEFGDPLDYGQRLQETLQAGGFDIVFLSAAVGDYVPASVNSGKISSDNDSLTIEMTRVPKFIDSVRQWAPDVFLVGFKLLVNESPENLVEVARQMLDRTQADVIAANDWAEKKAGRHLVYMVRSNQAPDPVGPGGPVGAGIVDRVFAWWGLQKVLRHDK